MAGNVNKVFLMGNLTRDPEVRVTPNNFTVCKFGLAVNRYWFDKNANERREEVTFVDCEAWGRTAENIGKFFAKGRPIFIEGRLRLDQWEDKEGGKRSRLLVVAEEFQFVDSKSGGSGGGGPEGGSSRPVARAAAPATGDYGAAHEPIAEDDIPF